MRCIFLYLRKNKVISSFLILLFLFNISFFNIQYVFAQEELELTATSFLLMENSTGKILLEKNSKERRPMASITKIMTMLLAMEEIDSGRLKYDDIITGSAYAKSMGGSTIFLDEGEQLTVTDIMKGIAVASGNDAAVAMAEHISGSEESFVVKMNERAKQLGMNDTNFVNCNGLDAEGHYSSAYDIAIMSRELLKHEDIHKFTTIWMDSLRDGEFTLSNTNKLIRFYDGATGLKTGSTDDALFCVSATAKRNNMHLIAVIMAAPTSKDRVSDASKLLNYGFANYGIDSICKIGDFVCDQKISKGKKDFAQLVAGNSFEILVKKGEKANVEQKIELKPDLVAPIKKGDLAGKTVYYIDNKKVGECNIVFSENIDKIGFPDVFMTLLRSWVSARI